jgi:hypothetical protein
MCLGLHILPYHDYNNNTSTYVYDVKFDYHTLTIRSNTTAWNNYKYSILLIHKR